MFAVCFDDYYFCFQDSCYKVHNDPKDGRDAAKTCAEANSHLVDIKSEEEQHFLAEILTDLGIDDIWIGLQDQSDGDSGEREEYSWPDGSPLNYTNWDENPKRPDHKLCVRMKAKTNYSWGEYSCTGKYWFVCEMQIRGDGNHRPPESEEDKDHS